MIQGIKPYPAYKISGVSSVGDVPQHWRVAPIGRVGRIFKGNGGSKEDEVPQGVPCVRYGDLYTQHEFFIRKTRAFIAPERTAYYTSVRQGDVLFAASGETIEDIGRSAVNLIESDACCGGDVLVFRPNEQMDARFLGYAADSPSSRDQKVRMGRGFTVVHIYGAQLRNLVLAIPPLAEQGAIVRFLDYVDWRIRRYIGAKQRMIRLLEDQKQAIINRAVTRGLDLDVRLKRSGVEWLGDVPEHWELRRNGRLFAQRNETGFPDLPILEVSLRTGVRVRDFENSDRKQALGDHAKYKRAAAGDIAYNMMRMWQGAVGIVPIGGLVSPAYVVARPLPDTESRYFAHLFKTPAYMREVDKYSRGIVKDRNRLYWEDFTRIPSCFPPFSEQVAIADAVAEVHEQTDGAVDRIRREISLLREYRTRLVADVVTGKLDVREIAALLTDDAQEPEPLAEADTFTGVEDGASDDLDVVPEAAET